MDKLLWREKIASLLNKIKKDDSNVFSIDDVLVETPPKQELGDLAFPLFPFSRALKMAPDKIASALLEELEKDELLKGKAKIVGPYLNIFLDKKDLTTSIITKILNAQDSYGSSQMLKDKKVMVEFSGPNTNKPLHLGHLRNDVIGESICRLFKFSGAEVYRVNIINNRGVHICKSMFAYQKLANGKTSSSEKLKSDHFVGDLYVAFHKYNEEHPEAEEEVKNMLKEWEEGKNEELMKLWKQMNDWALEGIQQTYQRTDVHFDKLYFESETYLKGKDEVLEGLKKGVFYKKDDGSIAVDLKPINIENEKILLRRDGTSLYITQDIGTSIFRHKDWPFDKMIYVVASEQEYHFKVLFYILKLLGYEWANDMHHLSYGMVNLPEGKMKSREGTVVDADDLLDELHKEAKNQILEKGRAEVIKDIEDTSEKIALAALHYFLLQITPKKDMLFDSKKSLSFTGNTGPYLQYMGSRISSLLEKTKEINFDVCSIDFSLLNTEVEWALTKLLSQFPERVEKAVSEMDSSVIPTYLYELSKSFSKFYHDNQIIIEKDEMLTNARLSLCKASLIVLKNAMHLCVIPFLEAM
ncbi:MAG: arginine--tRNA ligase [Treponema sp.]